MGPWATAITASLFPLAGILPTTGMVSDQRLLRGIVVDNLVSMETVSL